VCVCVRVCVCIRKLVTVFLKCVLQLLLRYTHTHTHTHTHTSIHSIDKTFTDKYLVLFTAFTLLAFSNEEALDPVHFLRYLQRLVNLT
jgi:hypothetical protein